MFRSLVFMAALAAVLAAVPGSAQDLARRDASSARVSRAAAGGILTSPSTAPRGQIVAEFMQGRGTDARTASTLRLEAEARDASTGLTRVTMAQEVEGLRVHGSFARAIFSAQGELLHLTENIAAVGPAGVLRATVDASAALRAALRELYPNRSFNAAVANRSGNVTSFDAGAFFDRNPTVTAVALPMTDNVLRAGYLVETWSRADNQLYHTVVGGDGRVLEVESRTNADSYNVFIEDPDKGGQTVVSGPGSGNTQSPAGWLAGSQTTVNIAGNNVRAYLDLDNNNQPDSGGTAVTTGNFLASADLASQPSTATNRAVAVQNLFYLNNRMHDLLYGLGFTEANGNFQTTNFAPGGAGNDAVLAEAQDGGGTDNANFATPADGTAPRMQMYLWNSLGDHLVEVPNGTYPAAGASFGSALTTTGLTGPFKLANDGVAPTLDACTSIPAGQLTGFIAIVDRGTCDFVVKVRNAQNAGAVGVVVVNVSGDDIFAMGGTDRKVRIPSVMIGNANGTALKAAVAANATTGTIRKNPTPPPMRDGSLDMDIVAHEYCHGLTWRMIGSMSGAMSGAIGEGMSDVCAFMINGDDRIGEYSSSAPGGIRRFPYSVDPKTYKSFVGDSVHGDGEIYAATIWNLRSLFSGNEDLLFEYLVQGMVPTAPGPYMEHMRDGILAAIDLLNRPSRQDDCQRVWQAFAARGIGAGARATPVLKKGRVTFAITESFTIPANACQ